MDERLRSTLRFGTGLLMGPTTGLFAVAVAAKFGNPWWLLIGTAVGIWALIGALGWSTILAGMLGLTLTGLLLGLIPSDDPESSRFTVMVGGALLGDLCILVGGCIGMLITRPYWLRREAA